MELTAFLLNVLPLLVMGLSRKYTVAKAETTNEVVPTGTIRAPETQACPFLLLM
jgi:hypothetical protein